MYTEHVNIGNLSAYHQAVKWPLLTFLARDSMLSALYAIACLSVYPSVTRVDQSKWLKFKVWA